MAPIALENIAYFQDEHLAFAPRNDCREAAIGKKKHSNEKSRELAIHETVSHLNNLLGGITSPKPSPALYITGLGSQYPPFKFKPEDLKGFLRKWYDVDTPG